MSEECVPSLGVKESEKRIGDGEMSSPNSAGNSYKPKEGRLDKSGKAWCSQQAGSYLMITLPEKTTVFGVASQGHPSEYHWVTKYRVEVCGETWEVDGNINRKTVVSNMFGSSRPCEAITITPLAWEGNKMCMRVEIYGLNEG